jgi:hypothetical protein
MKRLGTYWLNGFHMKRHKLEHWDCLRKSLVSINLGPAAAFFTRAITSLYLVSKYKMSLLTQANMNEPLNKKYDAFKLKIERLKWLKILKLLEKNCSNYCCSFYKYFCNILKHFVSS